MPRRQKYSLVNNLRCSIIDTAYRQLRASGEFSSIRDIAREIASRPVKVHYIPYSYAIHMFRDVFIRKVSPRTCHNEARRALYDSFIAHCRAILDSHPELIDDYHRVVAQAICSTAPSLGVSARRIEVYISLNRKRLNTSHN